MARVPVTYFEDGQKKGPFSIHNRSRKGESEREFHSLGQASGRFIYKVFSKANSIFVDFLLWKWILILLSSSKGRWKKIHQTVNSTDLGQTGTTKFDWRKKKRKRERGKIHSSLAIQCHVHHRSLVLRMSTGQIIILASHWANFAKFFKKFPTQNINWYCSFNLQLAQWVNLMCFKGWLLLKTSNKVA